MKTQTKKQPHIVGLKELRNNINEYISRVERGDSFTVVRRSRPVFRISPPDEDENWELVADFTKLWKGGVPADAILSRLKAYGTKDR